MRVRISGVALFTAILLTGAQAQTVQYRSSAGVEYRSMRDTGAVARAQATLSADPRNVDKIIALGVAQSGVREFREAIQTFTRGMEVAPNHAMLYRWRGHRHLSVREFDRAMADFTRGFAIDSTNYGILYHLGILRFMSGDFNAAADAFVRGLPRAPDAAERAGSTDWLWMSLSRAGRTAEARALLDRRPDSIPANNAYSKRLQLYRGQIAADQLLTPADTGDVNIGTLAYGLGNWYILRGDTMRARQMSSDRLHPAAGPRSASLFPKRNCGGSAAERAMVDRLKVVGRFAVIALTLCAIAPSPGQGQQRGLAAGDHTYSLRHGGRQRDYIVHMPRAGRGRALPVVMAFHGGGGEARGFQGYAGLDSIADREGFIVVYPNGSGLLRQRLLTWNAGECCGVAMNRNINDVGFAIAVLNDLARRTSIDSRRVYATGHSNGAMMSYRLAAERADRIAAIAPVAGAYNLEGFAPAQPVAVLHIHSADDPRALYNGGQGPPFPGTDNRSAHRPVMEGLERWRKHNRCTGQPRSSTTRTGTAVTGGTGQTATLLVWDGCVKGGAVAHWKLTGVGHGWPGTRRREMREEVIGPGTTLISAATEIWKFFAPISR